MSARPSQQGEVLFRLDSAKQEAALLTARRKIAETDAAMLAAEADIQKAEGQLQEAKGALQQARTNSTPKVNCRSVTPEYRAATRHRKAHGGRCGSPGQPRRCDRFQTVRDDATDHSAAGGKGKREAALAEAQVDLDKTIIRAGVDGRVEQFGLKPGDVVNPMIRTAGVLIPEGAGCRALMAGFGQIEAQVMKVGMVAEATCISKPWTIIPMVVTNVQDYIAAGQFRGGEQLVEAQQVVRPGTILVFMEPIFKGGLEGVTPGSCCVANAYTSNHELISSGKLGSLKSFGLHVVDATGLVHAMLLRIQALLLPVKTLVLSGHSVRLNKLRLRCGGSRPR